MNTLPGGLHACCIHTLLDDTEAAMVREKAALVFATLISYRKASDELCTEILPLNVKDAGEYRLDKLLEYYDLFGTILNLMSCLHVEENIKPDSVENDRKIVPSNLMRAYCVILSNLLTIKTMCGAEQINCILTQAIKYDSSLYLV